jgi:toxin ParE1/3/4
VTNRVFLAPGARRDLEGIFRWIADAAGVESAHRYCARLESYCRRFDVFPNRGTRRDDLKPGLRLVGFERRVTILFEVADDRVIILRLLYGGRDIEGVNVDR